MAKMRTVVYCATRFGRTWRMPMMVDIMTRTPSTVGVVKLSSNVPTIGIETMPPTTVSKRSQRSYEEEQHRIDD